MAGKTGTPTVCDTSERDGRYVPIRTNPKEDALQLHTDSETTGEHLKTRIRRSNGMDTAVPYEWNAKNRMDTAVYPTLENFGD